MNYDFCVYDTNYNDFLESFKTIKDAFIFCKKLHFSNVKIGKWINDNEYKTIKTYSKNCYFSKNGYHVKNVRLADFIKNNINTNCVISLSHYNDLLWTMKQTDAIKARGTQAINNFYVEHDKQNNFIAISHYTK